MDNIRRYMRLHGLDESMTEDRKVWSTRVAKVDTLSGDEAVAVQTPRVLVPDPLLYSLGPQQNGDSMINGFNSYCLNVNHSHSRNYGLN